MTRINAGIPAAMLTGKHLLAEHREIKRIPNEVRKAITEEKLNQALQGVPSEFRLGSGHVKFFRNKLGYLLRRYKQIHTEAKERGFCVQDYSGAWDSLPAELMQDYQPTPKAIAEVMARIDERIGKQ